MPTIGFIPSAALVAAALAGQEAPVPQPLKKTTPILIVEAIEPALPFWVERLGFRKTVEVPHQDRLGFVILDGHGTEVMLQTRASIDHDLEQNGLPEGLRQVPGGSVLYIEVDDLEALRGQLQGLELLIPQRRTFYGAEELWLREPGGNLVGFAQMSGEGGS